MIEPQTKLRDRNIKTKKGIKRKIQSYRDKEGREREPE